MGKAWAPEPDSFQSQIYRIQVAEFLWASVSLSVEWAPWHGADLMGFLGRLAVTMGAKDLAHTHQVLSEPGFLLWQQPEQWAEPGVPASLECQEGSLRSHTPQCPRPARARGLCRWLWSEQGSPGPAASSEWHSGAVVIIVPCVLGWFAFCSSQEMRCLLIQSPPVFLSKCMGSISYKKGTSAAG